MGTTQPRVIVLGNEKGGTGKSTVSMHTITYLLKHGYTVASIDIDARQGTLTRYLQNRLVQKNGSRPDLAVPDHFEILNSQLDNRQEAEADDTARFDEVFDKCRNHDFIVIDTPGNNTFLSRYAHSHADMIITPINDSFIDLDMLVRLDPTSKEILKPSLYAENVWEQKKTKAIRNQGQLIGWLYVTVKTLPMPKVKIVLNRFCQLYQSELVSGLFADFQSVLFSKNYS
jgi:chromosome partitioning protein